MWRRSAFASSKAIRTNITANTPYVDVKVCDASGNCQTIPDVMVDTGSAGLRLFAGKVALNLPGIPSGGGTLAACAQFASGYAWGSMHLATVQIGGEITTTAIPVQFMNDPPCPPRLHLRSTGHRLRHPLRPRWPTAFWASAISFTTAEQAALRPHRPLTALRCITAAPTALAARPVPNFRNRAPTPFPRLPWTITAAS
jgi:Protein of unknown function (DUF3443).